MSTHRFKARFHIAVLCAVSFGAASGLVPISSGTDLASAFLSPPDSARPGVYWYFMDGNLSREGMTRDLEAMKVAGLGHVLFLEVDVGVPRGPVRFLSEEWQACFAHAVHECERLGIELMLGSGPGWAGSGGPWVKPEDSMQHLVAVSVEIDGPGPFKKTLPVAPPRKPFFGAVPREFQAAWSGFFRDVAVLAFPTPTSPAHGVIDAIDEKALFYRAPFTSQPGVRPYFESPATYPAPAPGVAVAREQIVDLTGRLKPDGSLDWDVPPGRWTVMRFVSRNNGAITRPAPKPGLGFECDKWSAEAFDAHLAAYVDKLLAKVGPRQPGRGWTMLHIDSWEMGAQNWTPKFREEFRKRRGYDPQPFYPAIPGYVVASPEQTERFLWDLRQTGSELDVEKHGAHLKAVGRRHGMTLSIEPYDMHPGDNFDFGAVADLPMCEFWSEGFNSSFSCLQAASIAAVMGRPVVGAEAFTAGGSEAWRFDPAHLKNQGDWAFACGINRFTYHTFAHKPDEGTPGMVMGPYGVHWDRGQTWWPMVGAYHRYIARCQSLLRQGHTVADVLYLMPEGAPNVFQPPASAMTGSAVLPDRRGYNFDGCSSRALMDLAAVRDGRVVFPGGASYQLLVLPDFPTMTPGLIETVASLVEAGATVVGPPPCKSPSLAGYPGCDRQVAARAVALWGGTRPPASVVSRPVGRGRVVWGGELYPDRSRPQPSRPIEQARWIWYPEGNPAAAVEPCTRYFRTLFSSAAGEQVRSAHIEVTADNAFHVWLNGDMVVRGDSFHTVYAENVDAMIKPGENILAVQAVNAGDAPNPAGLIAALHIEYADGQSQTVCTDSRWQAARKVDNRWRLPGALSPGWVASQELGPVGMGPWQLRTERDDHADLYPDYGITARLLAGMGLAPDFETDGPIRYTHRRAGAADVYFVANREPSTVAAACTFRAAGRQPECWDPLTGVMRDLPDYSVGGGRTTVPMRFEPHQSFFVVFRRALTSTEDVAGVGENFHEQMTVAVLDGAWDLSFDPKAGGPRQVRFARLEDWSRRPETGIRYYSGIATYRKMFDLPAALPVSGRPVWLDLGVVHNLARVRLNGCDLGVVWCAPWRVDISDVADTKANQLEIEVANLWPNRLIGDKALPSDQHVTRTTYNPYRADSPLLPSGLVGPVTLQTAVPTGRE